MLLLLQGALCDRCGLPLDVVIVIEQQARENLSEAELYHRHCWEQKKQELDNAKAEQENSTGALGRYLGMRP